MRSLTQFKLDQTMWEVIDCPFNRAWYADLIGKRYEVPPSYARVRKLDHA